jgi:hypothetical protein
MIEDNVIDISTEIETLEQKLAPVGSGETFLPLRGGRPNGQVPNLAEWGCL